MRIVITGTTGGIGGAVKAAALAEGWDVVEINRGDFDSLDSLSGEFDAAVFATGTCPIKPLAQTDDALFAETIRVNCTLFLRLMRTLVAGHHISPSGLKAVAVSSVSATEGWPGGAAYCASKGALSALCRALDAELKPKGVSVEAMEPRYVKTRMFDDGAGRMGVPASAAISPQEFADEIMRRLRRDDAVCYNIQEPSVLTKGE